jgi:hypothetical protein
MAQRTDLYRLESNWRLGVRVPILTFDALSRALSRPKTLTPPHCSFILSAGLFISYPSPTRQPKFHRPSSFFIPSSHHPISHRKPIFLYLCTFKFGSFKYPQYEENFYRNCFADAGLRLYKETREVRCERHRETRNPGPGRPFHP